jgi:hypothetical protein
VTHVQINVRHPERGDIGIDEKLAGLIAVLWRLGLRTTACCQDGDRKGTAWIAFDNWQDVEFFLSAAAGEHSEEIESLYNRIVYAGRVLPDYWRRWMRERCWRVDGLALDCNADIDENGELVLIGPPAMEVLPAVYFPVSDVPEVESRLRVFAEHDEAQSRG